MVKLAIYYHRHGQPTAPLIRGICFLITGNHANMLADTVIQLIGAKEDETDTHRYQISDDAVFWTSVLGSLGLSILSATDAMRDSTTSEQYTYTSATGRTPRRTSRTRTSIPTGSRSRTSDVEAEAEAAKRYQEEKAQREAKDADDEETRRCDLQLALEFQIRRDTLRRIPNKYKPALIEALRNSPTCCISLEELVTDTGRPIQLESNSLQTEHKMVNIPTQKRLAASGVVAIFDDSGRQVHAYLFSKRAIDEWFAVSSRRTNPLTRGDINMQTQYFELP